MGYVQHNDPLTLFWQELPVVIKQPDVRDVRMRPLTIRILSGSPRVRYRFKSKVDL